MTKKRLRTRSAWGVLALPLLAACADRSPTLPVDLLPPPPGMQTLQCTVSVTERRLTCVDPASTGPRAAKLLGGQDKYVKLASSGTAYDGGTQILSSNVTVQNLLQQAIGTTDGSTVTAVQVFFAAQPTVTSGSGGSSVTVIADSLGTFTAANQPVYNYPEILSPYEISAARNWQFQIIGAVNTFTFTVYVETDVQYLLVINEVLANPGGTILDANGEWFEVYNAGTRPVDMQNLVIADSAASGRRPYHLISSSLVVPSGGYVTLGNTTNTTNNGGVTIDYAYGAALQLANSLDAVKVARVYGTDTLTLDRTQYSNAAVSAQNGISRELKNPALDNSNMDGSNWADALVTAVYGPGGRGTPKAQNSTFTP